MQKRIFQQALFAVELIECKNQMFRYAHVNQGGLNAIVVAYGLQGGEECLVVVSQGVACMRVQEKEARKDAKAQRKKVHHGLPSLSCTKSSSHSLFS